MTSTISLMMNGMQQFADANGVPYLGGFVYMYVPETTTAKICWVDKDRSAENSTPIELDSAGRCVIWGEGIYRQILLDRLGNTIWDKLTLSATSAQDVVDILAASLVTQYDLPISPIGPIGDGEELFRFTHVRSNFLPAGLFGSQFSCEVNPDDNWIFTIFKNGISIGTITFSNSGAVSAVFAAQVNFVAGDIESLAGQATADASGESPSFTFVHTVVP